jgi:hypothetical protein
MFNRPYLLKLSLSLIAAFALSACTNQGTDSPESEKKQSEHKMASSEDGGIERQPSPDNAEVYFIEPSDGETVSSPVVIKFGLRGMGVAPAGVKRENTGHHHLLVDTDLPENMNVPLPAGENRIHFGGGQTETKLKLTPGKHRLRLLLGDHFHIPHEPPVYSEEIEITVE